MGQLYEMVQEVDQLIHRKGLPFARTKGLVVIKAGFSLVLIEPTTPDDPSKAERLRAAVKAILGESI
jgi:hypothetical protein